MYKVRERHYAGGFMLVLALLMPYSADAQEIVYAAVNSSGAVTSFHNPNGSVSGSRTGAGVYTVSLHGWDFVFGNGGGGNVQVVTTTPLRYCNLSSVTGSNPRVVTVRCFNLGGTPSDSGFHTWYIQPGNDKRIIYAWADDDGFPASYSPQPTWAYNSAGAISITRLSKGQYNVVFSGAPAQTLGGTAMVTSYGLGNPHCQLKSYGLAGVEVHCYAPSGDTADSMFTVAVVPGPAEPARIGYAYVLGNGSLGGSSYRHTQPGSGVSVSRAGPGVYQVSFSGLNRSRIAGGSVLATAASGSQRTCGVGSTNISEDMLVSVVCTGSGVQADTDFTVVAIPPSLLPNGSFELPVIPIGSSDVTPTGWIVNGSASGAARLQNNFNSVTAADGHQWIELGAPSNRRILRSIQTVSGHTYRLRFSFANRSGAASSALKVTWNSESSFTIYRTVTSWEERSYDLWTDSSFTELEFEAVGANDGMGEYLDAIEVTDLGNQGYPSTTITTIPAGRTINVDGTDYTSPKTFQWQPETQHTISVGTVQGSGGTRYVFRDWADSGAATHTITAPYVENTITANFTTQHRLTVNVAPSGGGQVGRDPAAGDNFYDSGTVVELMATANAGYTFSNYSGDITSSQNPASVTMNAPRSVTANFTAPVGYTVTTNPTGLAILVDAISYTAPHTFNWTPGTPHSIGVAPTQGSGSTRHLFQNWSDDGTFFHSITVPASATTYTATYQTQYLLSASVAPNGSGQIGRSPAPADNFYDSGAAVQLTATANAGYVFSSYSGDLSSNQNPASVTMIAPRTVTANFTATSGYTITTNPTGLSMVVDGATYTAPRSFNWSAGSSHAISVASTQGSGSTRYLFQSWSDNGAAAHNITVQSNATTYTATFKTQYQVTTSTNPPNGGQLARNPNPADGFYDAGSTLTLTATANTGYSFSRFGGSVTSSANPYALTINAAHNITATFTTLGGPPPLTGGLRYVKLNPCRVMETRALYNFEGRSGAFGPPFLNAADTRTLNLPQSTVCQIPAAAKAYVLNVTVIPQGPLDFVTVWKAGETRPGVWTVRSPDGQTVANTAVVEAGVNGGISVYASNRTDMILDISGYFTDDPQVSNLVFYPLTPCRVIDTRIAYRQPAGPFGAPSMNADQTRRFRFPATPYCSIPTGAAAYSVTVTVAPPASLPFLTAWPAGSSRPNVSSINSFAGRVLANNIILPASSDGSVDVYAFNASDFLMDINGYFAPDDGQNGLYYYPVTQCRVSDTMNGALAAPYGGPIFENETARSIPIRTSACTGIPASVRAYLLNVTSIPNGSTMPFLTMYPTGQPRPNASVSNAFEGQTVTNSSIIPSGTNGAVDIYTYRRTHVALEISGYFGR